MQTKLMNPTEAEESGRAVFNRYPTLFVDIPDGGSTISARTSDGREITFSFLPYKDGGTPQAVDVCYHSKDRDDRDRPRFDVIGFSHGQIDVDTRTIGHKVGILCVLMDEEHRDKEAGA